MRSFLASWENGGREAWPPAWEAFGRLKDAFARLIGARARNIVITESTTAGINLAALYFWRRSRARTSSSRTWTS